MNSNNTNYVRVTPAMGAARLAKSEYFRRGYNSYMKNIAFDYAIAEKQNAVHYTRGRNFAIWCQHNRAPRAVWRNGVAANTVVERIIESIRSKYVI